MSSFWWNFHHWLHWKLSKWQLPVQPVIKISSKWRHFRFSGWRHNGDDGVSNHQPHHCLLNRVFRRRSKKTSKLRVTGLCAGNSPGTGEFPAQMASNAENVSIWWRPNVVGWCLGIETPCFKQYWNPRVVRPTGRHWHPRLATIFITMTSWCSRWRLKSPASRLFTYSFIQVQIKENINAPRHWPLRGEFTGDRWIPCTNGQ